MKDEELWKPIKNYERYMISTYGRVKSTRGKLMKLSAHPTGYLYVNLINKHGIKYKSIHRLVALNFIDNPLSKGFVNHIDFDRHNNSLKNLEWVTRQENMDHSKKAGRFKESKKKFNKRVIGKSLKTGMIILLDSLDSGKNYGFDPSCISKVCRGKRKHVKGFIFNYIKEETI